MKNIILFQHRTIQHQKSIFSKDEKFQTEVIRKRQRDILYSATLGIMN